MLLMPTIILQAFCAKMCCHFSVSRCSSKQTNRQFTMKYGWNMVKKKER